MFKLLASLFILTTSFSSVFAQNDLNDLDYGIIEQKKNTTTSVDCFTKSNDKIYGVYSTYNKNQNTFWIQEFSTNFKLLQELKLDLTVNRGAVIIVQSDEKNIYIVLEQLKSKTISFLLITVDSKSLKVVKEETLFTSTENTDNSLPILKLKKSSNVFLVLRKIKEGKVTNGEIKVECLVLDKLNKKVWAKTISMPYNNNTKAIIKDITVGENGEILIAVEGKKESYLHYYKSNGEFIVQKEISSIIDNMKGYVIKIKQNGLIVLAGLINNAPKSNELGYTIFDKHNLEIIKSEKIQYPMDKLLVNFTPKEQEQERKRQEKDWTLFTNNILVREIVDTDEGAYIINEVYYKKPTGEGKTYLKELIINKLDDKFNLSWTKLISKDLSGSIITLIDGLGQTSYGNRVPFGASYSLISNKEGVSVLFNDFKENKNIIEGKMIANDYKSGESCISLCKISKNGNIKKLILDKDASVDSNIKDYLLMHNSVKVLNKHTAVYRLDQLLKKEKKFIFISN